MGRQDRDWTRWNRWGEQFEAELVVLERYPLQIHHTCLECSGEGSVNHSRYDRWGEECPDCENNRKQFTEVPDCPPEVVALAYTTTKTRYLELMAEANELHAALMEAMPLALGSERDELPVVVTPEGVAA